MGPAQSVNVQIQVNQAVQGANFGRYLPIQPVVVELNPPNPAIPVGGDAVPFAQRGVGKPVLVVEPVVAIRGLVQRHQSIPVGLHGSFPGRAHDESSPLSPVFAFGLVSFIGGFSGPFPWLPRRAFGSLFNAAGKNRQGEENRGKGRKREERESEWR